MDEQMLMEMKNETNGKLQLRNTGSARCAPQQRDSPYIFVSKRAVLHPKLSNKICIRHLCATSAEMYFLGPGKKSNSFSRVSKLRKM